MLSYNPTIRPSLPTEVEQRMFRHRTICIILCLFFTFYALAPPFIGKALFDWLTLLAIKHLEVGSDSVVFETEGKNYVMFHDQDCCESVRTALITASRASVNFLVFGPRNEFFKRIIRWRTLEDNADCGGWFANADLGAGVAPTAHFRHKHRRA